MHPRRPSPASIIASVALFFALGGTATAARQYLITSTGQIKPSVLKKLKGKAGPASTNGTNGANGKEGKEGPRGVAGANGTNGATNVVVRYAEITTGTLNDGSAEAKCDPGERATGGGVEMYSGNAVKVWYFDPGGRPFPRTRGATPTGWSASWYNESVSTDSFRVYAICAS